MVLWNDLAIALADYRRRGSSITTNAGLLEAAPGAQTRRTSSPNSSSGEGIRRRGSVKDGKRRVLGSPNIAAAAAASTGEAVDDDDLPGVGGERGGGGGRGGSGLNRGESGLGSPWPRLAAVAAEIGKRVKWFPRMRTAEASLLQ